MSYNYPLLWLTNPSIFYAFPPLFSPFPNHYMTCHDLAPPTIVTDDLNIAYFRFQMRRTVSLGWRFNEIRNVVTSKHWCEGWIVRPSHPLPLLSKVSQCNNIIYLILIMLHGFVFLLISQKVYCWGASWLSFFQRIINNFKDGMWTLL